MRSNSDPRTPPIDRRAFLAIAGAGGLAALTAPRALGWAPPHAHDLSRLASVNFDLTYSTEIMNLPSDTEELKIWMPLPPTDDGQEIRNLKITCPHKYEIRPEPVYGNRTLFVSIKGRPDPFTVAANYQVERRRIGAVEAARAPEWDRKYLKLTDRVRVTSEVEAFTRQAVGEAKQPVEKARAAFDAILGHLTYDKKIPGCGTGDTAWIMKHRRGKCDDFHALFMAMMISCKIPLRWEQGFPLPNPLAGSGDPSPTGRLVGDCSGAHCWVSFFDPDLGWVPVDITEAAKHPEVSDFFFGKLSPNRFKISEGRSIVLDPPQGGDPLPTFAYAYSEADGIPLIYSANYENTIHYKITDHKSSTL